MKLDPFTLRIALDEKGSAQGELYLDDRETFSHQDGQIVWREFVAEKPDRKDKILLVSSRDLAQEKLGEAVDGVSLKSISLSNIFSKSMESVRVERLVIIGLTNKPKAAKVEGGEELEYIYDAGVAAAGKEGEASVLVVKDPGVAISKDRAISIEL